ncbi:YndM family protein [Bacillus sp. T33-2]|uniref:YndM family protein n=1 Tax=Bacillus sp. T33-2 TaxID=2054168 RepID=UPI000C756041|nr:YndM family protein [Bacillus sp. T33-2]PLR96812.1 hypothetical protein CVD19_10635 [Bacillus sp. T33-2]
MRHLTALGIKLIGHLAVLYVILGLIFDMAFINVFLITVVVAVTEYLVGDLGILPRTNNSMATLSDFGLSLAIIWFLSAVLTIDRGESLFFISLVASLGIAAFEWFFHKYVATSVTEDTGGQQNQGSRNMQFQTEASEEISPAGSQNRKSKSRSNNSSNKNNQ